ncbi:hypothetical protein ACIP93_04230 [Streptomyces sp. NPDC088745]|uniref:hypothetical protein n=1 Tax=Streptomyces sp. NPDC088745 TaxID=3365884 RepID=UPI003827A447
MDFLVEVSVVYALQSGRVADLDGLVDQLLQFRRQVQELMSGFRAEVGRSMAGGLGVLAGNCCGIHVRDGLVSVVDLFLRRRTKETKTRAGKRPIGVPEELLKLLIRHKEE